MASLVRQIVFAYHWHEIADDVNKVTNIRMYGLSSTNKTVCVTITGFTHYCYIELPAKATPWTEGESNLLFRKIKERMSFHDLHGKFVHKHKLMHAHIESDGSVRKHPFILVTSQSKMSLRYMEKVLCKPIFFNGETLTLNVFENNASAVLQLTCNRHLPTAGWIEIVGKRVHSEHERVTTCDAEYIVDHRRIKKRDEHDAKPVPTVPQPLVMAFDIEVNSSNPNRMPNVMKADDKVFQVSCVLTRDHVKIERYLLTLGRPDHKQVGENVTIWMCRTEAELLSSFATLIQTKQPQIITGYNIFGFDIPYMIDRAKRNNCIHEFDLQGYNVGGHAIEKEIKWSSAALRNQNFRFLDVEGRLYIDLMPVIQRDYRLENYKLKTVSEQLLKGSTKDPLTPKGIFRCYRLGMNAMRSDATLKEQELGEKALGICGKYCVQDSELVLQLFNVNQTFVGLVEMAATCNVPMFTLFTQGQQIKVFSQVYKLCMEQHYVIDKVRVYNTEIVDTEDDHYTGAMVFDPAAGAYDRVVPFDFNSLYPTTLIAYNICMSTLVKDDDPIPDSECHVIEWFEEKETVHLKASELNVRDLHANPLQPTLTAIKYRYKFYKNHKGIIPTLLESLLDARKQTRAKQKLLDPASIEYKVLEKRQLAFKVSANSVYGALGSRYGALSFQIGAKTCTALGRQNLQIAARELVHAHGATLIYGDTDSCYVRFKCMDGKTNAELWDHCVSIEKRISQLFPRPMYLQFEEVIYDRFLILSKKRYICLKSDRMGNVRSEPMVRGLLLTRRDNASIIRDIYTRVVMDVFYRKQASEVLATIVEYINIMFTRIHETEATGLKKFTVTKSIGDVSEYKIKPLPTDPVKRAKRLKDLECDTEDEYTMRALPAHMQLAEKMRRRGKIVVAGQRLEYVVCDPIRPRHKLFDKIEDVDVVREYGEIVRIDHLYYLKMMTAPLDEVLEVAFGIRNFVHNIYKLHMQKNKLNRQLELLCKPIIIVHV